MVAGKVPVGARRVPGQRWTRFTACCSDMLRGVFVVLLPASVFTSLFHLVAALLLAGFHRRDTDEDFENEAMHVRVAFLMLMASSSGTMWAGRTGRGLWEMAEKKWLVVKV